MSNINALGVETPLGGTVVLPNNAIVIKPPKLERIVVITFDDVPDGSIVDTVYKDRGVAFASITTQPPSRGHAYARKLQIGTALSDRNVLTLSQGQGWTGPFFDARQGAVEVTFTQLQMSVTVWAYPLDCPEALGYDDNRPFMEAFDTAGNYLGRARTQLGPDDANFYFHWQPITFSAKSAVIKTIRLSSQAHGSRWVYTVFDNLTFHMKLFPMP